MFGFVTGGYLFMSSATAYTVSFFIKNGETTKENVETFPKKRGPICRLPVTVEKITDNILNDPNDPNYIGNLVIIGQGGAEYNL